MDKTLLHLLIIGELAEDGETLARLFRTSRYALKTQRVADKSGLQNALEKGSWDAIIFKNNLAHLRIDIALDVLHRSGRDLPFIVFAAAINGDEAAQMLELGAHDVVATGEPRRLVAVLARELESARARVAAQVHEGARKEVEQKLKVLSETIVDAVCYSQDGMHVETNESYLKLFGYEGIHDLEGIPVLNLVQGADQTAVKECFRRAARGNNEPQAFTGIRKDGSRFAAEMRIRPVELRGEPCHQITVYDRTTTAPVVSGEPARPAGDLLTGLPSRQAFLDALAGVADGAILLYIDIEDLRGVNERDGMTAGDALLQRLGHALAAADLTARGRVDGDAFAVVLTGDAKKADAFAKHLSKEIAAKLRVVAVLRKAGEEPARWLGRAETTARRREASQEATGTPRKSAQKLVTPTDTRILYQPIVPLHGAPVEQFEVLLQADGELLKDIQLIPAPLDLTAFKAAVAVSEAFTQKGRTVRLFLHPGLAFMSDRDQVTRLRELVGTLDPKLLVFEIDEAAMGQYPDETLGFMRSVKRMDFGIALDAFGTGVGNVRLLAQQPVDFVKIDPSLIHNITSNSLNQMMTTHVVALAKKLGKQTIAKSVDNADTLSMLWQCEVDFVQGYYFQEPNAEPDYDFGGEVVSGDVTQTWRPAS